MAEKSEQVAVELPEWVTRPLSDIQTLAEKGELSGDAAQIQEVLDRYSSATVERNLPEVESCFVTSDDFLIVESSYPNFGWNDFKKNHLIPELEEIEDIQHKADVIQAFVTSELAYAVFKYKASGVNKGNRRTMEGLGTAVLVPTDDGWKIRHWATCSRRPPTAH
ncbi:MAG: nuclear transport factor 2 family protein [Gammaproteobacteria bacterium]|nr:nuclear transport factor 2 family protein [Gammaproteobacteria bacterium]